MQLSVISLYIVIQVIAAWVVNRFTSHHSSEIARARLANLALASHIQDGADKRRADLMRAAFFLESLGSEIRGDDIANPVRVAFLRANFGVLSVLFTVLSGLFYFDVQHLLSGVGTL